MHPKNRQEQEACRTLPVLNMRDKAASLGETVLNGNIRNKEF